MQRYSQTELTDYGRQLNQVNARFAMDRILNTELTPAQSLSLINDPINENAGKIFKINQNNRLVFLDDNLQTQVLATLAENERAERAARVATIAANATGANSANSANSLGSIDQFMDDIRNLSGQPRRRGGKSRKSRKGKSRKNHKKSNRTRR